METEFIDKDNYLNNFSKIMRGMLRSQIVLLLLFEVIVIIVFAFFVPYFFTIGNVTNIALQATVVGLLALGQTFVLITGGIDLSSVANLALSGVVGASIMKVYGIFPGIITMIGVGVIIGFINGISVVKIKMVPFMVTLATMTIITGIALFYTKAITIGGLPHSFVNFSTTKVWIFPLPVLIVIVIFAISYLYLHKGSFGVSLFSVGLNCRASYLVGLPVSRIIMTVYVLSGLFAGIAAILLVSKLASAAPGMVREDLILDNISAAVIGGASLYGGRGTVGGAVIGILFIVIIGNAMNLLGVSPFTILIIKGFIILFAIFIDAMRVKFLRA